MIWPLTLLRRPAASPTPRQAARVLAKASAEARQRRDIEAAKASARMIAEAMHLPCNPILEARG